MVDKKTFVLAVIVSWALTLVTVLLVSNFVPSFTQPFTQQFTESNSIKLVTFSKQEVQNVSETNDVALYFNFTWTPSNPNINFILSIESSFEYRTDELSSITWENKTGIGWFLGHRVSINEYNFFPEYIEKRANTLSEWNQQWSSEWEKATYQTAFIYESDNKMIFNQSHYPIQLFFVHNNEVPTYIRNVNLTLLVIDG